MGLDQRTALSRRAVLRGAALGFAGVCAGRAAAALPSTIPGVRPQLLSRALAARARHGAKIANHGLMAIADFNAVSSDPRFHLVDLLGGQTTSLLVAHGRGSDPGHTGWLEHFSNDEGSAASSAGAFVTRDIYDGKHGRSRRLLGLDGSNSNAEDRAIVVHAAWYVSPDVIRDHGKIGRSEGCFAVSDADLEMVLARLPSGTLIYADKV